MINVWVPFLIIYGHIVRDVWVPFLIIYGHIVRDNVLVPFLIIYGHIYIVRDKVGRIENPSTREKKIENGPGTHIFGLEVS